MFRFFSILTAKFYC